MVAHYYKKMFEKWFSFRGQIYHYHDSKLEKTDSIPDDAEKIDVSVNLEEFLDGIRGKRIKFLEKDYTYYDDSTILKHRITPVKLECFLMDLFDYLYENSFQTMEPDLPIHVSEQSLLESLKVEWRYVSIIDSNRWVRLLYQECIWVRDVNDAPMSETSFFKIMKAWEGRDDEIVDEFKKQITEGEILKDYLMLCTRRTEIYDSEFSRYLFKYTNTLNVKDVKIRLKEAQEALEKMSRTFSEMNLE